MIPSPSANFTAEEAKTHGARKVVLFTIFPFYHRNGIASGSGTFLNCAFIAPDKIQADYGGYVWGYWYSPILEADLGHYPSAASFSLSWNSPGYDITLKMRSAMTEELLAAASWETVTPGEEVGIYRYYQWGVWWEGYRCWANDGEAEDDYTAWAQDEADSDSYDSYACDSEVPGDSMAYIYAVLFTGEYPVPLGDVIDPGELTLQASIKFEEMIAGDHNLKLANAHRNSANQLAPKYSPHKSSSIFAGESDWFSRKIKIEAGYVRPGTGGKVFDLVILYLGQIYQWGPLTRSKLPTVEIYSKDWIAEALKRKIALPDSEGNEQPLFHGEYLAKADEVSGKPLTPPLRTVGFEEGNLEELDNTLTSGNGALTVNSSTPLVGDYSCRAEVSTANDVAYGSLVLPAPQDELFVRFAWRWTTIPTSPTAGNLTCWKVLDAASGEIVWFYVNAEGKLVAYANSTEKETNWSIATHEGIRADVSLWVKTGNPGNISLWIGGDQVLEWDDVNLSGVQNNNFVIGLIQGATAETWVVDVDNLRFNYSYLPNAFQVQGYPFTEIKSVYVDNQLYTLDDMTKSALYGYVSFAKADGSKVSGDVMVRVVKDTLIHPVDLIDSILTAVNLGTYINSASFATAKSERPDDQVGVCFKNVSAAEAIIEITRRCLYSFFVDQGEIKLKAYSGTPPASAVISLNESELRNLEPTWNMEDAQKGVLVKWGWFDRNPDLFYAAGEIADGDAEEIDLTWNSPVATESELMAKALANLLFKRLRYGVEILDAVRSSWRSLRVELGDGVGVEEGLLYDEALNYETLEKVVSLGPPYKVELQLARFLGE